MVCREEGWRWKRSISGQSHSSGATSIACCAKGTVCVQMGMLFRGNPKSEINQVMTK